MATSGRARAWTLRAVRALHDPAWTADGYVSDRWRPVSPVTGRLDAFQWQTPVASLPSDKSGAIESSPFEEAMLATPRRAVVLEPPAAESEPATEPVEPSATTAAQDNAPRAVIEPAPVEAAPVAARPRHRRHQPNRPPSSGPLPCSGPVRIFRRPLRRRFRP